MLHYRVTLSGNLIESRMQRREPTQSGHGYLDLVLHVMICSICVQNFRRLLALSDYQVLANLQYALCVRLSKR